MVDPTSKLARPAGVDDLKTAIARPAPGRLAYDPATITSSFLTDLTPGTPDATFAAFSRRARVFAVPESVTTPSDARASIARNLRTGSAPRADLTLAASAASSSTLGGSTAFRLSPDFATSIFPSAGWGAGCTTMPADGLGLLVFHNDWIWSHAARFSASAPAVTA